MPATTDWLTKEQAAEWLNVPVEVLQGAIQAGEIPALSLGNIIRISSEALLTRGADPAQRRPVTPEPPAEEARPAGDGRLPNPAGLTWVQELTDAPAFAHGWPRRGGGTNDEAYPRAWQGAITLQGEDITVRIGECTRHDRGRLTVFFNREAICEFVETTDGQGWASVVKPDGKKVLQAQDTPPPLYRDARLRPYREVTDMTGIGVPRGQAVVIDREDHTSAVHQAAARWLGKRRFPVEPAE